MFFNLTAHPRPTRRPLRVEALEDRSVPAAFAAGNLAILQTDGSGSNTSFSIIELDTTTAGQTPTNTIAIPGTGTDAMRISGSATSTAYLSRTDNGQFLTFNAVNTTNTSSNVNALNPRAVGTLDANGTFAIQTTYTGSGTNQTRSSTSLDNSTWFIADQGGLYTNDAAAASPSGNLRGIKAFGGTVYVGQASSTTTTIQVSTVSAATGGTITGLTGLTNNSNLQDFYLIQSGDNGSIYDVLYVISATSNTAGTIAKYSFVDTDADTVLDSWASNQTYTTTFGGFGLAAEDNGNGSLLYVSTGQGALTANSVLAIADTAGYNANISITTGNNVTLYTAPTSSTIIKGVAFTPEAPPNTPPVAQASSVSTNEDTAYTFAASDFQFTDADSDPLTSITIGTLSLASGDTLEVDQGAGLVAVTNGMTITAAQLATMVYTPLAGASGLARSTFTFTANDAASGTVAATMTINVTAVNDVPVAQANTVTAIEDTPFVFASEDFPFTDAEGDSLVSITIGTLSLASGDTLQVDQGAGLVAVTNGMTITAAQLATMVYTPAADAFGAARSSFTFTVNDAGSGTVAATLTIDVTGVADTPSVTNASTPEDTQTTSGLVISRNAADGAEVTHFQITGITNGTLFLNNGTTPITNGAFITFAQANAGLRFTPAANFVGDGSFDVQASTSNTVGGLAGGFATATITVTAVADTPTVTNATTQQDQQTTSGLVITPNPVDGATVTHFQITSITNGTLFLADGTTPVADGDFITAVQGGAGLRFTPSPGFTGSGSFVVQAATSATVGGLGGGTVTATITVTSLTPPPPPPPAGRDRFAAGAGLGSTAVLRNLDGGTLQTVTPFGSGFTGGVRVASADVNGDGFIDLITAAGPGGAPTVVVFDGLTGTELVRFDAFERSFTGGVYVAAGDFDGDGKAEVVATADQGGGPVVAVFRGVALAGGSVAELVRFLGIDDVNFRGGSRAAVGDVNGDGVPDVVVSAGFLGGPRIQIWNGVDIAAGTRPTTALANFFAFEDTLRNGCFVAVGDVDGDGFAELVFGGGPGGGPRVRVVDSARVIAAGGNLVNLDDLLVGQKATFFAGYESDREGVRVASFDATGDGVDDVVTGSATLPTVKVFSSPNFRSDAPADSFDPLGDVLGGVFVG